MVLRKKSPNSRKAEPKRKVKIRAADAVRSVVDAVNSVTEKCWSTIRFRHFMRGNEAPQMAFTKINAATATRRRGRWSINKVRYSVWFAGDFASWPESPDLGIQIELVAVTNRAAQRHIGEATSLLQQKQVALSTACFGVAVT
jgi:hypothetical protein